MKNNYLIKDSDTVLRVLDEKDGKTLVINCKKKSMPKWVDSGSFSCFAPCSETEIDLPLPDINELDLPLRKCAYERFTLISSVLPFITNKERRCAAISQIAIDKAISKQTISKYLWLYLVYQNISALAPKEKADTKELTEDEKNIRWALNKFYYTQRKHTLKTAYTLLLKEKYCDETGTLLEHYPTFYQFRYFYRKHKKMQTYYISRDGIKAFQRNHRALLGEGIQQYAYCIGFAMLDATVCDIYLVNDSGGIVGRPILTACVDAYSGLCCGYSLSWEGGVYSLRNLMINVIADKQEWCKRFGIDIDKSDWNCFALPATLITDMGREYTSNTFEQLADLGVSITNLSPYRPDLKGAVEKFFDVIQGLYKPHLIGKGVIQPDYMQRGIRDYRKDACLTMAEFEKIIIKCIIYYNTQRVIENFPYTEKMLTDKVKPHSNCIWNYGIEQMQANLIPTDYDTLVLTLLPRTTGKFTRKGLVVNKIRYKNDAYTERFLSGGDTVTVAYNPDDVSGVWLIENGKYTYFSLIERRFEGESVSGVSDIRARQQALINADKTAVLQAKIDLANDIEVIAANATEGNASIKGIRQNRQREQRRTHIDYVKEGTTNE